MRRNRLKLIVSFFVVTSHIAVFFITFYLQSLFALESSQIFTVLGSTIPLFGVFTTIIVKDSIRGQLNLSLGPTVSAQMIMVTFLILLAYIGAVAMTFRMFLTQVIVTAEQLGTWISLIESAFGITLGLIVDSLFGGDESHPGPRP